LVTAVVDPPDGSGAREPDEPPALPSTGVSGLARYVLLECLGRGGAGVVFAAHDPELDRRVAIKFVRAGTKLETADTAGQFRLLREAQAMARLAHPNVIHVYDVAAYEAGDLRPAWPELVEHDEAPASRGVFLVMELVEGDTLKEWLEKGPRDWREVLRILIQAGRGISAAHQQGLVHRDFKPGNVLVGYDGRVRVLDFGLARAHGDDSDTGSKSRPILEEAKVSGQVLDTPLTQTGTVLGTPQHMAPEQHRGEQADASADQFSFCVVLFESLYGKRPYDGRTIGELRRQKEAGQIVDTPKEARVPAWLRKVVLRGLAADPPERYPSMASLLDELERKPRRRRLQILGGVAAVALLGSIAVSVLGWTRGADGACEGQEANLRGIWDDEVRASVREGLLGTKKPFAEATWKTVQAALDGYATRWVDLRQNACHAALVERSETPEVMAWRNECLDRRLSGVMELTRQLRHASADIVERAAETVAALPDLDVCGVGAPPAAELLADEATRAKIVEIDGNLARASASSAAGSYPEARAHAEQALSVAESLSVRGPEARARLEIGRILSLEGDEAAAEEMLHASIAAAEESGEDDVATRAYIELISTVGVSLTRQRDGDRLADQAGARIRRRALEDDLTADYHHATGALREAESRFEEARTEFERALAIREQIHGPDDLRVGESLSAIAIVHHRLGQYDRAHEMFARGLQLYEGKLGPFHPQVGRAHNRLGIVQRHRGESDAALEHHRRALEITEDALGAEHPAVADMRGNLALIHIDRRELEIAHGLLVQAVMESERAYGADSPRHASKLGNLGLVLRLMDRPEDALDPLQRQLAIYEKVYEPDNTQLGYPLGNLAETFMQLKRYDEARTYGQRVLGQWENKFGAQHAGVATALATLGLIELGAGNLGVARGHFERGLEIYDGLEGFGDFALGAKLAFGLARTLPARQRKRSIELARRALAVYRETGGDESADKVEAWLRENDRN
jgi:tetratricopeptide (TPR) repeat protein